MSDYQMIIDNAQVVELPMEVILDPIICEVPIDIKLKMDVAEVAVQT